VLRSRCSGRFQRDPVLARDRVVDRIDTQHAVHPSQAQDDRGPAVVRHRTAQQGGVTTLGHDGHPVVCAPAHDVADLLRRAWSHDGHRAAMVDAAVVGDERLLVHGIHDAVGRPDEPRHRVQHGAGICLHAAAASLTETYFTSR